MSRIRCVVDALERLIDDDKPSENDGIISLYDYVERIDTYSFPRCDSYLICALVLMDRLSNIKRDTIHMLFYLSYFYSSIYLYDYKIDVNRCFSVAGMNKEMFTDCSARFLQCLEYNISVSKEEYDNKIREISTLGF